MGILARSVGRITTTTLLRSCRILLIGWSGAHLTWRMTWPERGSIVSLVRSCCAAYRLSYLNLNSTLSKPMCQSIRNNPLPEHSWQTWNYTRLCFSEVIGTVIIALPASCSFLPSLLLSRNGSIVVYIMGECAVNIFSPNWGRTKVGGAKLVRKEQFLFCVLTIDFARNLGIRLKLP